MARRGNGPGQGAGWGGPSRGSGFKAAKAPRFAPANRAAAGLHDMSRSARRLELLDALFNLARTAENEDVQVSAAVAWLNRVEGKPIAQAVHVVVEDLAELEDDALEREVRSYEGRI